MKIKPFVDDPSDNQNFRSFAITLPRWVERAPVTLWPNPSDEMIEERIQTLSDEGERELNRKKMRGIDMKIVTLSDHTKWMNEIEHMLCNMALETASAQNFDGINEVIAIVGNQLDADDEPIHTYWLGMMAFSETDVSLLRYAWFHPVIRNKQIATRIVGEKACEKPVLIDPPVTDAMAYVAERVMVTLYKQMLKYCLCPKAIESERMRVAKWINTLLHCSILGEQATHSLAAWKTLLTLAEGGKLDEKTMRSLKALILKDSTSQQEDN